MSGNKNSAKASCPERMKTHQWDSSFDPEISPLFLHLQWAQAQSLRTMRPVLAAYSLSLVEFDVLATLRNAPPPFAMTPKEIQNEVVVTSGGLTKIMAQLEARGLLVRSVRRTDLRVKPMQLSTRGKKLIEKAMAHMIQATGAWIRAALTAQEIAVLSRYLAKIS